MAGIIKAAGLTEHAAGTTLRAFQFDDVSQAYLERVKGEAAQLLADARRQAAQIKTKATEEGRQAAIQAVEASLRTRLDQQLHNALAAVKQAAQEIAQSRQTWQQHWERHVVTLAVAIAGRICRRELAARPEITLELVREALELAAGNADVTLRLHPDDHASLADQVAVLTTTLSTLGAVRIVADPTVTAGGCRVDTQFGSLDQQLEAQLARITEELLG
jgi:flagellar assembly protein FliH